MLMEEKQAKYRHVRTATERFTDWFEDINQHEIVAFISMMQQVKGYLRAMEKLPEEKAKQFIDQVQQDFLNFYQKMEILFFYLLNTLIFLDFLKGYIFLQLLC